MNKQAKELLGLKKRFTKKENIKPEDIVIDKIVYSSGESDEEEIMIGR